MQEQPGQAGTHTQKPTNSSLLILITNQLFIKVELMKEPFVEGFRRRPADKNFWIFYQGRPGMGCGGVENPKANFLSVSQHRFLI